MASTANENVLLARVARYFYLDDRSKSDIAVELGISRFRVARLLEAARREGVVRIEVASPPGVDGDLSGALQARYGLRHSVVIEHESGDLRSLRQRLGHVAADLLRETVTSSDVLGLAWARSLREIGPAVSGIAACPVLQLTGALSGPDGSDVLELVRKVAAAGGGEPHVFYAPLVAPDPASARNLRRQPEVARAMELAAGVTVAVVGVGAWAPGLSTIFDMAEPPAREQAATMGTVGEISGALIDVDGRAVDCTLSKRIVGVSVEQLRRTRTVVSVAYGRAKAPAVRAALRSGLINGLVTHTELAHELLADEPILDEACSDVG